MLVITWHDDGKHKWNSSCVSLADKTDYGLLSVDISTISGSGGYYGAALEDFICEFDKKLNELMEFRKMLDEQYQHQNIVYVDCFGNEIKSN